jgi:hypothetical protein
MVMKQEKCGNIKSLTTDGGISDSNENRNVSATVM